MPSTCIHYCAYYVYTSTHNSTIVLSLSVSLSLSLPPSLSLNSATEILRLASPVISATFQCDNCTTSNLSTPVNITFTLTPYDQVC